MPGPGKPTPQGVSASLDAISQAKGTILLRTADGWSYLEPGPAGSYLVSNGPGELPTWSPATYDARALDLFANMTVTPDAPRKALINALILALDAAGAWAQCDVLYLLAAHDEQAARLNWKAPTIRALTAYGAPAFTVDRGFTGDGVDAYLGTGVAAPALGSYAQNSAHLACWSLTDSQAQTVDAGTEGAFKTVLVLRQLIDKTYAQINNNTLAQQVTVTNSRGHFIINRSGANAEQIYRNGTEIGNSGSSSVPINDIGEVEYLKGWGGNYSARQLAHASAGASLSPTQASAYYLALAAYLAALGAI